MGKARNGYIMDHKATLDQKRKYPSPLSCAKDGGGGLSARPHRHFNMPALLCVQERKCEGPKKKIKNSRGRRLSPWCSLVVLARVLDSNYFFTHPSAVSHSSPSEPFSENFSTVFVCSCVCMCVCLSADLFIENQFQLFNCRSVTSLSSFSSMVS